MNTTQKGSTLEIYVAQIFKDQGKLRVRRNVLYEPKALLQNPLKKKGGYDPKILAQVDVEYWDLTGKTIVECKHYPGGQVGIEELVGFYARGRVVDHNHSLMITTGSYTDAAKRMARKLGIRLIDKKGLEKLDYERLSLTGMIAAKIGKRASLEEQLRKVSLRGYSTHQYEKMYKLIG